jgi:hypothetical protein
MVRALDEVPAMARRYTEVDGKPAVIEGGPIGLGLAVDVPGPEGSRSLLVPVIGDVVAKDFAGFLAAYEAVIRRIRANDLDPAMFVGATLTITNPGTIGTMHSVPRLMPGQAVILGVGSIDLPAAFQAADPRTIADLGVSKVVTITSTYDHRVIQGAESGAYLKRVHELLIGEHDFYDDIFRALGLPYEPARWRRDDAAQDSTDAQLAKQLKVSQLVNAYRVRGHLIADLDPLRQKPPRMHPELDPNTYGLSIWDLDREFLVEIAGGAPMRMQLGTILAVLRDAYCRTIGVEFGHVLDPEEKRWLRGRLEGASNQTSADDQQWIIDRLNAAEAFESFLHTKYVGQKRFGLEGAESLIPLLDAVCEGAADAGLKDVVMGMAHRGRLNVLSNVIGKSHRQIFGEFEGELGPDTVQGSGDVKYHLGAHGTYTSRSGATVDLHLPPNPSHLEAVDPVVEGIVRAMQDRYDLGDAGEFPVLPLLVHGEVTDRHVDIFDREAVFIEQTLRPLTQRLPRLRVVLEHITTADAVRFVRESGPLVAATITAHHLLLNRNDMLVGGIRPHYYCLPILKRASHQQALIDAATSGDPKFFLGTDSAPHATHTKESACGCAGVYTAHAAIELYAEVFEAAGKLDHLEAVASHFGADFYRLPRNTDTITLHRTPWAVPDSLPLTDTQSLTPLRAGSSVGWQFEC